jgi:hypothetical protein
VVAFLSDGWIEALDRAARGDAGLAELAADVRIVVEQHVTGTGTVGGGDVRYHVSFADGVVSVRPGPADDPTLRFTQDLTTAVEVASGRTSAQRAFMTGRLQVGGDLSVLLAHGDLFAGLADVFAAVRADTDLPSPAHDAGGVGDAAGAGSGAGDA